MLKVFVINLASSDVRRNKVIKRLKALGVDFEIFEAVDGRQDPHPLFERYDDHKRRLYRRKKLAGGELGCFASHFLLWEKCAELNQPIVVMEDDVYVANNFGEAVTIAQNEIETLRYIRLAGTSLHRRPYKTLRKIQQFDLVDHIRGPSGTLCYVLHPDAAKSLLDNASRWFVAVDDYMDRYWGHGIDCYSLMPFPVMVADNGSDIIRNPKEKMSLWGKVRLEFFGRLERIRRTVYRLCK